MNDIQKQSALSPASDLIAIHLLRALTRSAMNEERVHLGDLAREVGIRRADARRVLSMLDRQGYVDVLHMRPTLLGFALGHATQNVDVSALRLARVTSRLAA